MMESAVNYVNAPMMAKERGIKIIESKGEEAGDFTSSLTVKAKMTRKASKSKEQSSAPSIRASCGSIVFT